VDAAAMRAGAEKLVRLHEEQARTRQTIVPMTTAKKAWAQPMEAFNRRTRQAWGKSGTPNACKLVAWDGIEPPTRGFSVRCSTS
jgi:hypothetical protein